MSDLTLTEKTERAAKAMGARLSDDHLRSIRIAGEGALFSMSSPSVGLSASEVLALVGEVIAARSMPNTPPWRCGKCGEDHLEHLPCLGED